MYTQTLQQVRSRSGQSGLAAEGLQQVCDQIEVDIKRLDLLLCFSHLSMCWETVCGRGMRGAIVQARLVVILQKGQIQQNKLASE